MMQRSQMISIPERENAPATNLHIKLVYGSNEDLGTKPFIFMLPGGPGANHSHYKDYACLQDVGNVIFFDPRGCGLSDKGDQATYTMDNYIDDLNVVRKQLGLESAIVLGKSYGAMCALGYAIRYPKAVSQLILAAGAPNHRFIETSKANLAKRGTAEQIAISNKLWDGNIQSQKEIDYFFDVMAPMYSYKIRHGEEVHRPQEDYPFSYQVLNQGFGGFLRAFDFEDQLSAVKSNTLILVGEQDWVTDKKHSQLMADKIPSNKFVVFEKSDHSMESDVPDRFFSEMKRFITLNLQKKNDSSSFFKSVVKGEVPEEASLKPPQL